MNKKELLKALRGVDEDTEIIDAKGHECFAVGPQRICVDCRDYHDCYPEEAEYVMLWFETMQPKKTAPIVRLMAERDELKRRMDTMAFNLHEALEDLGPCYGIDDRRDALSQLKEVKRGDSMHRVIVVLVMSLTACEQTQGTCEYMSEGDNDSETGSLVDSATEQASLTDTASEQGRRPLVPCVTVEDCKEYYHWAREDGCPEEGLIGKVVFMCHQGSCWSQFQVEDCPAGQVCQMDGSTGEAHCKEVSQ
jgi:hypothetical protein